ncbi:GNAT family N-acetyltransferase [Brachybacterium sp. AOP43-C2-M15]|uniref:GNAT family N-acetyltransferase n=1 Tax=Brachybacterium sp. AOP43-C2-M15 TaxID=3457661 RepID=UPI0040348091
MILLERLGPRHAAGILAGQDEALAAEIVGKRWTAEALDAFLARAARWRADGPIREYAAVEEGPTARIDQESAEPELIGGGGLALLGPGLGCGQAALTYWILAPHRRRGHGLTVAEALVGAARAEVRISQLVLRIAPTNLGSQAVAAGLGAVPSGEGERHPADANRTVERWVLDLREH